MSLASRRPRIPIMPLSADLTTRILDALIYQLICETAQPEDVPMLQDDLVEMIEALRRPHDPPAKLIAAGLILKGLETVQDVIEAQDYAGAPS